MEFTELLDDLRLNRFTDVVQKKTLAEAIQLSSVMVYYNYESGTTKKPNMEIIERLCDFYRVSADYFISSPFRQYACSVPYMIGYNSKKKRLVYEEIGNQFFDSVFSLIVSSIPVTSVFASMIEFAEEGEPLLLSLFENSEKYNYYRPNYERPNYNRPDLNKKDYYHAMMIKVPEPFYITPSASSRIYLTYHKKIGLLFTSFTFKDKEEPKVDIFYKLNEIDGIFQAEQYSKSYPISPDFTFIAEIDDILKP